jgi:translation initiation factor 3 subunit M
VNVSNFKTCFLNHRSFVLQSSIDEDGIEAATEAALGAIRDPVTLFQEQRSLLETPAIQALAGTELHGLLGVFQEGKLQDYRAFPNKEAVLAKYGLNEEECTRHMRILSLCSLAAETEEVPYDVVAKTLEVSPDEVESWVIAAVSSGLLSAKMDQIQQKIMVERSVVRKFDMGQWTALQSQLHLWKTNLRGILDALKQADRSMVIASGSN